MGGMGEMANEVLALKAEVKRQNDIIINNKFYREELDAAIIKCTKEHTVLVDDLEAKLKNSERLVKYLEDKIGLNNITLDTQDCY